MSFSQDAVAAVKSTFFSVVHKHETKPTELPPMAPASPPTAPELVERGLLAVARDSADIRRNHDAILTKAASLSTLQDDLLEAFDRAYLALEQLAEARSQLAKAEAVAKFEREERVVAAQRLSTMTSSYHQTVAEVGKLRPELKRLETTLRQTADRLEQQETEAAEIGERLADAQAEIGRLRAAEASARRDQDSLAGELASANAFIARKMAETSQLGERCEIAEQAARASSRALEESRSECANALVRLDEERVHFASAQSRISALETQLRDLSAKFSSARADWSQDTELLNEAVSRLKNDLSQALGRDEAHQRLLSAAQSELSALRLQSGELETQLVEARHNAAEASACAAEAEAARDAHAKEAATSKRLNQSLLRRVKPMITALREKNTEGVRLSSAHAELERHFLDYQAEAGDALRNLQDRETQLVADLEVERARRVVAEGALAIDRSFRPTEASRRRPFELEGVRIPSPAADGARQIPPPAD